MLRKIVVGPLVVVSLVVFVQTSTAQTDAIWNGGDGNWFDSSNWSTDPIIPNGGGPTSEFFNVRIDNASAVDSTVNTGAQRGILVESLRIDSGDTLNVESETRFGIWPLVSNVQSRNSGSIGINDGELTVRDSWLDNSSGMIAINNGSRMLVDATSINGGAIHSSGSGRLQVINNSALSNLILAGIVELDHSAFVTLDGTIDNRGTIDMEYGSEMVLSSSINLVGGGTINLRSNLLRGGITVEDSIPSPFPGGVLTNFDNTIRVDHEGNIGKVNVDELDVVNEASGSLIVEEEAVLTVFAGQVTNHGLIDAGEDAFIGFLGPLNNHGVLQTELRGEISAFSGDNAVNTSTGLLTGSGTFSIWTRNDGRIAPGSSVGTLTMSSQPDGVLTFGDTAVLEIEIDSAGSDLLTVFGNLLLDGALQIDLLSGFVSSNSDVYQIISILDGGEGASFAGTFDGIADGDRAFTSDGRGSFLVDYTVDGVFLRSFLAVPEPTTGFVLLGICGGILLRRQRA